MSIERVTVRIERAIEELLLPIVREDFLVIHYGANDIHPKHLVYSIILETDEEKHRLANDSLLMEKLRRLLDEYDYPIEGRDGVHIGFESKETVDRESNGNFWHHWK